MKISNLAVVLVVLLSLTIGLAPASQAADKDEMIKAATALDQTFLAAFNKGDAQAMAALYWNSPDVVLFTPDELIIRGHDAIAKSCAQMLADMKGGKLELTESHQIPAGDIVISWGLWRITMSGPDGKPTEMAGRYTDAKAMRDGKWVYIMDHASAPMSPPPAEMPSTAKK